MFSQGSIWIDTQTQRTHQLRQLTVFHRGRIFKQQRHARSSVFFQRGDALLPRSDVVEQRQHESYFFRREHSTGDAGAIQHQLGIE